MTAFGYRETNKTARYDLVNLVENFVDNISQTTGSIMSDKHSNLAVDINQPLLDEKSANQFLTFTLDGEYYGVDILQVQEIKAWTPVTKVPNTPNTIKGVLNLRGEIVPIVDMRAHFGLSETEHTSLTVIIVLSLQDKEGKQRTIGIIADSVSDVVDIGYENLKSTPELGEDVKTDFIRSIATVDHKMVMLLDIMLLVNTSTLDAVLAEATDE